MREELESALTPTLERSSLADERTQCPRAAQRVRDLVEIGPLGDEGPADSGNGTAPAAGASMRVPPQ